MKRKVKRLLTISLCAAMTISELPVNPDIIAPKSVYAEIAANTDGFVIEHGVLKRYVGSKLIVRVPDGVTEIEKGAFTNWNSSGNTAVEKVILPNTVQKIDDYAFYNNGNLTSIEFSSNLYYLGEGAFSGCKNLQYVDLSKTKLKLIPKNAFSKCMQIYEVKLPDSLLEIGSDAFYDCKSLAHIEFPEGLISIGGSAFGGGTTPGAYGMESLYTLNLPSTLKSIGGGAFHNLKVTSIKIPAGIEVLQPYALYSFTMKEVLLPDTLKRMLKSCIVTTNGFNNGAGAIEHLYIPDSVEGIVNAESFATSLYDEATFKEVEFIKGSYAETYMNSIKESAYPKAEYIPLEYDATINFDASGGYVDVTSKKALKGKMYGELPTPLLKGYTFTGWCTDKELTEEVNSTDIVSGNAVTLYARWEKGSEKPEQYEGYDDDFSITEDGTLIGYYGDQNIVVIPDSVKKIEGYVFKGNNQLVKVIIPDSVVEIGPYCFTDCGALLYANIPEKVTEISERLFSGCSALIDVEIEGDINTIGEGAFNGCSAMTHFNMPDTVTAVGQLAFSGCASLLEIELSEKLTEIGSYAFTGCSSLVSVRIPAGVQTIKRGTFKDCSLLTELILTDGLKEIEKEILGGTTRVTSLYIPESVNAANTEMLMNIGNTTINIQGIRGSSAQDIYEYVSSNQTEIKAGFTRLKYDAVISYDPASAGAELTSKKAIVGQAYGSLETVTKDGFVFVGWTDGSKVIKSTDIVEHENITLKAVWRKEGEPEKEEVKPIPEGEPTRLPKEKPSDEKEIVYTEISTAKQLYEVRNNLSGNYKLVKDIDLSALTAEGGAFDCDYGWMPIGVNSLTDYKPEAFTGIFDGNGHTITGLNIFGDTPYYSVGLFAKVSGGQIKNLTLKDVNISVGDDNTFTGALAGYSESNVVFEGITVTGNVTFTGELNATSENIAIGGIVGGIYDESVVTDCHNKADIAYFSNVEEKPEFASHRFLGGIAGYVEEATITACSNAGTISGYRNFYGIFRSRDDEDLVASILSGEDVYLCTGGICGIAMQDAYITECYNIGDIYAHQFNTYSLFNLTINSHSNVAAGGIVGLIPRNTGIMDCYNTGSVYGYTERDTTIVPENLRDSDDFIAKFIQLLDANTVNAPFQNTVAYVGGILGNSFRGYVKNCYNIGALCGSEGATFPISGGAASVYYCRYLENETFENGAASEKDSLYKCRSFSTEEMGYEDTYRTFDLANTWLFVEDTAMERPLLQSNMERKVTSVKFTSEEMNKTSYNGGDTLDLSGISVALTIKGMEEPIEFVVPDTRECGFDASKSGMQTIVIDYFGTKLSSDCEVTVKPLHRHEYKIVFEWNEDAILGNDNSGAKWVTAFRRCDGCGDEYVLDGRTKTVHSESREYCKIDTITAYAYSRGLTYEEEKVYNYEHSPEVYHIDNRYGNVDYLRCSVCGMALEDREYVDFDWQIVDGRLVCDARIKSWDSDSVKDVACSVEKIAAIVDDYIGISGVSTVIYKDITFTNSTYDAIPYKFVWEKTDGKYSCKVILDDFETSATVTSTSKEIQDKDGKTKTEVTYKASYKYENLTLTDTIVDVMENEEVDNPFADVPSGTWYTNEVLYVYKRGAMTGLDAVTFAPKLNLSRAMTVTLLWKLEGSPVMKESVFPDVNATSWKGSAVAWAKKNGIVTGYSSGVNAGLFKPDDNIKRQDFIKILYEYAQWKGLATSVKSATAYTEVEDYKDVSNYAKPSVNWGYENGLIGNGSNLNPQNYITRREAAVIIARFLQLYKI